ncbi:sialate O-acetylesterase [Halosquirtibacter xylanolyticus]|uniref:sialate O-acetylesterase n=1 Tax=Halosquirtibacter xylanolyticus TaxID=3374599 RepID=UPI00374925B7|nr:sialate O-acetylesterase [Prolixibacteraceae bacterium]
MKQSILLLMFLWTSAIYAQSLKIPQIIGSNMVLQRNDTVKIWGWSTPEKKIRIKTSWNKKSYTTYANGKGKWTVSVVTTQAGGPYQLEVKSANEKQLFKNILLGEVWLFSGQSNMNFNLKGSYGSYPLERDQILLASNQSKIRIFDVDRKVSLVPSDTLLSKEKWEISTPQNAANTSAIAYMFALQLHQTLNVPIGIIHTSYGGSYISAWLSKETLKKYNQYDLKNLKYTKWNNDIPSAIYNAMLKPLAPYGIKGALWYQGESDRKTPQLYIQQYQDLANDWRSIFQQDFPIYMAQIAPFGYKPPSQSQYIREAQIKAANMISQGGIVITSDVGEKGNIHPHKKKPIADRFLRLALNQAYGMTAIDASSPRYETHKIDENKIVLQFKDANEGLHCNDKDLKYFEIAGINKKFYPAKAKIVGRNKIEVSSKNVTQPIAVRYGWRNFFIGNIYDSHDLPLSSFRTDKW